MNEPENIPRTQGPSYRIYTSHNSWKRYAIGDCIPLEWEQLTYFYGKNEPDVGNSIFSWFFVSHQIPYGDNSVAFTSFRMVIKLFILYSRNIPFYDGYYFTNSFIIHYPTSFFHILRFDCVCVSLTYDKHQSFLLLIYFRRKFHRNTKILTSTFKKLCVRFLPHL